jgi:hypothetical protein
MTPVAHPAADSEEAAPCEPDPAPSRSQSASPRLLEGGRRNEGARCRRERPAVRPEHPMSSSDARGGDGVCYGCGEAEEVLATTRLFSGRSASAAFDSISRSKITRDVSAHPYASL